MANLIRGGFRPRHPGVRGPRRYEVDSSYGTALFPGDAVTLVTAGTVQALSAGGADLFLGVVAYVSYVSGGRRQYGTYIPATTVYSPTSRGSKNASYAWVWDDPTIEYIGSVASNSASNTAALAYASVGSNCDITATAGDTIYAHSNHVLDGNVGTGTLRCRILDVLRDPAQDLASANWKAVFMIDEGQHPFFSQAGI